MLREASVGLGPGEVGPYPDPVEGLVGPSAGLVGGPVRQGLPAPAPEPAAVVSDPEPSLGGDSIPTALLTYYLQILHASQSVLSASDAASATGFCSSSSPAPSNVLK